MAHVVDVAVDAFARNLKVSGDLRAVRVVVVAQGLVDLLHADYGGMGHISRITVLLRFLLVYFMLFRYYSVSAHFSDPLLFFAGIALFMANRIRCGAGLICCEYQGGHLHNQAIFADSTKALKSPKALFLQGFWGFYTNFLDWGDSMNYFLWSEDSPSTCCRRWSALRARTGTRWPYRH